MRTLFWLIALFAVAAGLAHLAHLNTGYAVFVFPPYRAHVSMNFLIIAMLTGFITAYIALRLLSRLLTLPGAFGAYRARLRHDRGENALHKALLAYFGGHWREALRQSEKAFKHGQVPGATALLAAHSAQGPRLAKKQAHWLAQAQIHEASLGGALPLSQAELALHAAQPQQAKAWLKPVLEAQPKNPRALALAMKTALAEENHAEVVKLASLPDGPWPPEETDALVLVSTQKALTKAAQSSSDALLAFWQQLSSRQQHDQRILETALPLLAKIQKADAARRVLEQELDKTWNDALARSYWHTCLDDLGSGMARAEKWLIRHPKAPGLLFSLGRLCAQAGVFGKAEGYLDASCRLMPTQETHLALAHLFETTDRQTKAIEHYRLAAAFCEPLLWPARKATGMSVMKPGSP